jgi:hypothetical protein
VHNLTILKRQRRRLRVNGCHSPVHDRVWRILQRHRDGNADEAGRHGCGSALGGILAMLLTGDLH